MRKLQQVALIVAAAGGLSAVGAGPSSAAPDYNGGYPPPASQPDAQASSASSAGATAQSYGPQQAAPQRGAEVTPEINPTLSPSLSPQISPQATPGQGGDSLQSNLFRPSQECSPQSLLGANVPVALLAAADTHGIECSQGNTQSNALAHSGH
ncbi:hypothetical protein [Streptomyces roseochromogenus]|uniref:Chaplin domain-containing protein n=1 Tax=Streptomyces roseochromogenus subsp. oscitans DS 12.976 TaxID=1352936 RepID=V6K0Y6_STRRC|nr:hypothetical protein [Streptomyces roseochromogenus]EST25061.1 hypothetical protein M878_29635 [Streptomyces roseochromogenus subsp. oscitans DS 12.976]